MASVRSHRFTFFGLAAASLVSACGVENEVTEEIPVLAIPAPRAGRPALPPEQAALLYSGTATRDPFLTEAEQAFARGGVRTVEATPEDPPPGPRPHTPARPKAPAPLNDTRNIILGSHGSFEHNGRHYAEGDVIEGTVWVVESVSESGAKVRSKDGLWRSFVRFPRQAEPAFDFRQ